MTNLNCCLIYAGGTFGSHGVPLSPLSAEVFLPILQEQLAWHGHAIKILDNDVIKDSSSLTPSDFVHFYQLIIKAYADGCRQFVLITGTDTLSFLAAFLANALADFQDLSLVITGSMQPLLIANSPDCKINTKSDAWANLSEALMAAQKYHGVFVQFYHQLFDAKNTQKIHSQEHNAFTGNPAKMLIISSPDVRLSDKTSIASNNEHLAQHLKKLPQLIDRSTNTGIELIYALPNHPAVLAQALRNIDKQTVAVILAGFGAGNLPQSAEIITALQKLQERQIFVISTSMCAYGGVNSDYAAGAWQYSHGVFSAAKMSIAGIYGKTLWLAINKKLTKAHWEAV